MGVDLAVGEAVLLDTLVGLTVLAESVVLYIQSRLLVYRFAIAH